VAALGLTAIRCAVPELTECGQTGLTQVHLLLAQHLLAVAAMFFWQCSIFHRSSRSNWSTVLDLKLTFRRAMHELRFQTRQVRPPRLNASSGGST